MEQRNKQYIGVRIWNNKNVGQADGYGKRLPHSAEEGFLMEKIQIKGLKHDIDDNFLGVKTVSDLNRLVASDSFRELVQLSEAYQDKRLIEITNLITEKKKRVILIAGPSGSGKTTTAKKLCIQLKVNGLAPLYLGTDDYFVERENTPLDKNGKRNYEDLEAVDVELFNRNINELLSGEIADLPVFDFMDGKKIFGTRSTKIESNQPIVIEGIHALNDELTREIANEEKFKIFVCPITAIHIEDNAGVDPIDHRMLRRMVRDNKYRGHSAQQTIDMWPSVRRGENKNIFPFENQADINVNTSHIYEIPILKKYAWPLLAAIERDEPEFAEARKMMDFLDEFESYPDDDVIPNDSILREFIGGSTFTEADPAKNKKMKTDDKELYCHFRY